MSWLKKLERLADKDAYLETELATLKAQHKLFKHEFGTALDNLFCAGDCPGGGNWLHYISTHSCSEERSGSLVAARTELRAAIKALTYGYKDYVLPNDYNPQFASDRERAPKMNGPASIKRLKDALDGFTSVIGRSLEWDEIPSGHARISTVRLPDASQKAIEAYYKVLELLPKMEAHSFNKESLSVLPQIEQMLQERYQEHFKARRAERTASLTTPHNRIAETPKSEGLGT